MTCSTMVEHFIIRYPGRKRGQFVYRGPSKLCDELDVALKGSYVHTVEVEGIFAIHTRLWWHQTEIPGMCIDTARTLGNATNLSISYARHCIYLDERQPPAGDEEYMSIK
jgi:hypothetical protein